METSAEPEYVTVPRSLIEQLLGCCKPMSHIQSDYDPADFLDEFILACKIDYRMMPSTIVERKRDVERLLRYLDKHPALATRTELRLFLAKYPTQNAAKAVRILYGRFLSSDIAQCFRIPQSSPCVITVPSREQLRQAYDNLDDFMLRLAFMLLASSGLRRHELLELTPAQIDMARRMIRPARHGRTTKLQWACFFNAEAEIMLREALAGGPDLDVPIFKFSGDYLTRKLKEASDGLMTPKTLRAWFCNELGRQGTADRFVDALCGRVPRSVLARNYTDYAPERLKEIYDKAGLKVLG